MSSNNITRKEAFHILTNSQIVSEHFDSASMTATYTEALAALHAEEPGDNDFLIIDKYGTERYSKDYYRTTPIPSNCRCVPLDARVVTTPSRSKQEIAEEAMETLDTLHPDIDYGAYSALADAIQELANEADTTIEWKSTENTPPTESDGLNNPGGFHDCEIIAIDQQGRAELWPWDFIAKYWLQYPLWARLPAMPATRKKERPPDADSN